jgi:hypothetical protein
MDATHALAIITRIANATPIAADEHGRYCVFCYATAHEREVLRHDRTCEWEEARRFAERNKGRD